MSKPFPGLSGRVFSATSSLNPRRVFFICCTGAIQPLQSTSSVQSGFWTSTNTSSLTRISKLVRSIWSLLETYCILDTGLSLFLGLGRTFRSEQFLTISTLEIDEIGEATYTADGKSYQMIVNNSSDGAMDSDAEFILLDEIVRTGRYHAVSVVKNFGGDR